MIHDAQFFYMMLALPALFGLSLCGEGIYKMSHYQSGWISMTMGVMFLATVAFGFFFLRGYLQ